MFPEPLRLVASLTHASLAQGALQVAHVLGLPWLPPTGFMYSLLSVFWQEYRSGLRCPPPGDLTNPEMEPVSLSSPSLAGGFFTTSTTRKPISIEKELIEKGL